MPPELEFLDDAGTFLAAARALLEAHPVESTVLVTASERLRSEAVAGLPGPSGFPVWWLLVRDEAGTLVGAGMRTAPFGTHPVYLTTMPDSAARGLAAVLHGRGEVVRDANGALPAAEVFAAETARLAGASFRVAEQTRLHLLGDLREPDPPPGRARLAHDEEVDQVRDWYAAFGRDAAEQAGRTGAHAESVEDRASILRRIREGTVWVWEDPSGVPVHVTGASRPMFGVSRIGPVYTPREQRGRGYAGSTVAAASRSLVREGAQVCLFTDRANPVSNALYERLGYRPLVDQAHLVID